MLCSDLVGSHGSFTGAMTYTPVYLAANPIPATATWPVTPAATAKSGKTGTAKGGKKGHRERRDPGHTAATAYTDTGVGMVTFPGTHISTAFTCTGCPDGAYTGMVKDSNCANAATANDYQTPNSYTFDHTVNCVSGSCIGNSFSNLVIKNAYLAGGLSIINQDHTGSDMLCVDLARTAQGTFSGVLAFLSTYTTTFTLTNAAVAMWKPELATAVTFSGVGFTDGTYPAHVHADTCANDAGAHFCGTGAGTGCGTPSAVNEVWPEVTCTSGVCTGMSWNDFGIPATGTFSIVVHDAVADTGTAAQEKMLCADMVYANSAYSATGLAYLASYTALVTAGTSTGYGDLTSTTAASAKGGKKRARRDPGHSAAQFTASFGTAATTSASSGKGGKKGGKTASVASSKAGKVASVVSSKGGSVKVGKSTAVQGVNLAGNNGHANNNAPMFAGGFTAAMVLGVGMYTYQKKRATYTVVDAATPLSVAVGPATNSYGSSA
jgi:hypothetical protein